MNKIMKELDIMYGPDAAPTYYQRQGQHLADLEQLGEDNDKYQKKRAEIERTLSGSEKKDALAKLDAEHKAKKSKGGIRLSHIAQILQSAGAATEGRPFRMETDSCKEALVEKESHPCSTVVESLPTDTEAKEDHFELDHSKLPNWVESGGYVDPFDYIDEALAFKGPGTYFFPLNVVSHHAAMIVALIIPNRTMERTIYNEDGEERTLKYSTSAFGGSKFLFFLDQFNDNLDLNGNLVTRENGLLQDMLMHFTINRGFMDKYTCEQFVKKFKKDFDGRKPGDKKLCDDTENKRKGCDRRKRCWNIGDSMIWQMLPAHDMVIDKEA